jgi:anaerobic selenocysteine-containing dehydrogenase
LAEATFGNSTASGSERASIAQTLELTEPARYRSRYCSGVDWRGLVANYDHIRAAIEHTIPGFENYNARVRQPGGFYLPNGPREGRFPTPSGKAHFTVHPIPPPELQADELVMMTIRSHDQFNTTIYGLDDRYRGIFNERRVVLMNARDIEELGFNAGEVVDLVGNYNGATRIAYKFIIVAYDIPRRCCATYFPEANVLVPLESVAEKSNTPVSKYVVVRLRRTA